jgi:hypothetical protein
MRERKGGRRPRFGLRLDGRTYRWCTKRKVKKNFDKAIFIGVQPVGCPESKAPGSGMTVETLGGTIETLLSTTEKLFVLGELRISAALSL